MKSFKTRVADFWRWFEENEAACADHLADISKYEANETVAFISKGLELAIEDVKFEAGGNCEINLAPEGDRVKLFLTTYLVNSMPDKFAGKWRFSPFKPAMGEGFEVRMHGASLSAESVMVAVEHEEGDSMFYVSFYHPAFLSLDESAAYGLFQVILASVLGENICLSHIGGFELAKKAGDGMKPLSTLPAFITDTLAAEGRELLKDPCDSVMSYTMDPTPGEETRADILTGFTGLAELFDDFYVEEDKGGASAEVNGPTVFDRLKANGAKAVFISYPHKSKGNNNREELDTRYEIAEKLEREVLGKPGSGREIGQIVGQAFGLKHCYIDLLLFDEDEFMAAAPKALASYDYSFSVYDFCPKSQPVKLAVH